MFFFGKKPAPAGNTIVNHPTLTTGLEAYYKCDTNGSFPSQVNSPAIDGTINGATYTASGKIAGAYNYNGVNQYISIPNNPVFHNQIFSISFWVNFNISSATRYISMYGDGGGGSFEGLIIRQESDNRIYFKVAVSNTSFVQVSSDNAIVVTGQWIHCVCIADGSNIRMYVDGVKQSGATSYTLILYGSDGLLLGSGRSNATVVATLGGGLDEWAYWSKALTDGGVAIGQPATGEVGDLFAGGPGLPYN